MECQLNWLRKQPRDSTSNRLIDADGIYPAVYVAFLNWFGSVMRGFPEQDGMQINTHI